MNWSPREQARIDLGLCFCCGEDSPVAGILRCAHCRDRENAAKRRKYALRGKVYSDQDKAEMRTFAKNLRDGRKRDSKCVQCAAPITRYTRCTKCRAKNAEYSLRYWRNNNQLARAA